MKNVTLSDIVKATGGVFHGDAAELRRKLIEVGVKLSPAGNR